MNAAELLSYLSSQGFTLTACSAGIRIAPASRLTPQLRQTIRQRKAELLALLGRRPGRVACPGCGRPQDTGQRCWKCCDRACANCGKPTGSAFIELCLACEVAWLRNQGLKL